MSDEIKRIDSDEGRTYETPNGILPSVTSRTALLNKPFLVPWAAKMAADYFKDEIKAIVAGELNIDEMDIDELVEKAKAHYKKKQEEAKDYGSDVHRWVTEYFSFGSLPKDEPIRMLVESAIKVITEKLRLVVGWTEEMVYYKSLYAGTLDLAGVGRPKNFKKTQTMVVDLKTGKGRVYEDAFLQVAAYAQAKEWLTGGRVNLAVIVPLNKETGEADEPIILNRLQWRRYFKAFEKLCRYADLAKTACQGKPKKKRRPGRPKKK